MSGIKLISLPIGNPKDITLRALETLKETNTIYCEDTRVFKDLCRRIDISYSNKSIRSFHDHSSQESLNHLIEFAVNNDCCFVSDAGSPLISDPAYPIIKEAITRGVKIDSVGGINSVTTALELSGLAPIPYHFHGFLPRDNGKIDQAVETFKSQYGTHIFFEGVSRADETLKRICTQLPNWEFAIGRELTKEFESVYRFCGSEYEQIRDEITWKGEFVIVLHNPQKHAQPSSQDVLKCIDEIYAKGAKPKVLAKLISEITGESTKVIYTKLTAK